MKKTAILLYPQFSEYELSVALSILMQGDKPIVTVGLNSEKIKGESGLSCIADTQISEVNLDEIDSLLLPGCMDIALLINEQELIDFIGNAHVKGAIIASISSSPSLLAKAGVLKNRKYTVGLLLEDIRKLDFFDLTHFSDDLVVQDGNIITARGRGFIQFGITIGKALHLSFDENWYRE
ncbi:4-methyl-5(B-hydroxyethyl)-thiazole monophosphate biosynthesis protein [Lysinibacillus sphaericus]|uniref:DJ-1/PfpI family protein n=1 Tax=Lysinibacillus sphaericus TaxID=1421 RepID=UPI0018CCCFC9|nr:DJ-1/PfpI family protein [Lysinibacillus sphaericus]MBG9456620.1 4-methyl-5(B-hydroxyethyl)-thiazole monophosphate biosynthesis protein [Lysinibacillus sphaericus]MBG9480020.1 4-methyl-5(B-hydroxyethyl)-thiazole monophosphate biosynthesis protein [Lysinibacillus sphaericus]MBG9594231.1 4-methyl-5(B-hydroxyethyl)-thiazole monophosphate biosynthesis protein [Lysinibacillus sphaericus]